MMRHRRLGLLLTALACGCAGLPTAPEPVGDVPPTPAVEREMRGLWIATVANIDWPSSKGLTASQQQAELVDLLNRAAATGFNTIVLQVRPAADALYQSSLEPWASWLTGNQGENPGYDPLAFALREAHARGMQLHAWINPFRAGNTADTSKLAATHVFNTRREFVRIYGGNLWMDPGAPEAQDHSMRVIADIVTRYDIDGIHADDYFYPYQIRNADNQVVPFPDDATYTRYGAGVGRDDWRRANIDRFVERMYREVHAIKPTMAVGISPFGIWRPGFPASVQGLDAFATIYADSRKWLQQGWVDYFAPQLYWAISAPQQSFPALLDWWVGENAGRRHVWPGLAAYRVQNGTATAFSLEEIPAQVQIVRQKVAQPGAIFYNTTFTLRRLDATVRKTLETGLYATPALVPAYRWLDSVPPPSPTISVIGSRVQLTPAAGEAPRWWLVRGQSSGGWTFRGRRSASWSTRVVFAETTSIELGRSLDRVIVTAVDAAGNASAQAEWRKP